MMTEAAPPPCWLDGFAAHATAAGAEVHAAACATAPALVTRVLQAADARRVALEAAVAAMLPGLAAALTGAGLTVVGSGAPLADLVAADAGVSVAAFAVAETGSVALASPGRGDRLVSMLPATHVVIVRAGDVLADLDAASERLRAATSPRGYVSLVTGPSRTADIERVLTIGVHGPRALHVVVLVDV
jgi:L-lactate dehydrogenase complex protein LldG